MSKTEQTMFFIFAVIMIWELFKFSMESLKEWVENRRKMKPLMARMNDEGDIVFSAELEKGVKVTVEYESEVQGE